jgi:hypothetical protein
VRPPKTGAHTSHPTLEREDTLAMYHPDDRKMTFNNPPPRGCVVWLHNKYRLLDIFLQRPADSLHIPS